jgi:hypothetical protein
MQITRLIGRAAMVALAVTGASCGGDPTGFSGRVSAKRFFAAVYAVLPDEPGGSAPLVAGLEKRAGGPALVAAAAADPILVNGVLRSGLYPVAAGAPGAAFDLESSIVTGMPAKLRVAGDGPFTRIALTVPGAEDYWEIVLPVPVFDIQVVATGASSIPNPSFTIDLAVGNEAGFGKSGQQAVQAVDLANSDIAVILRWNAYSDVDLHVTDAKGVKVYFANPRSAEGGQLDLDSNPACNIDGVNQEVITWPLGRAPLGEYRIEVDYWSDCGVPRSDYGVTFMVRGRTVQVVNGFFEGRTSAAAHHEVARFTFP